MASSTGSVHGGRVSLTRVECVLAPLLPCSILYQRGIYPPETFSPVAKYGLSILVTTDEGLKTYMANVLRQLAGAHRARAQCRRAGGHYSGSRPTPCSLCRLCARFSRLLVRLPCLQRGWRLAKCRSWWWSSLAWRRRRRSSAGCSTSRPTRQHWRRGACGCGCGGWRQSRAPIAHPLAARRCWLPVLLSMP